jgi:hypothetical protein
MKKAILIITIIASFISCKKEYDEPVITFPEEGEIITLDTLLNKYVGYPIKFENNLSMYATVTMDETDGNIYKSIYIQDGNKAINLRLLSGGGLYVGDSIRIDLKGTVLNQYNGVMQLDSVDIDKNIVKQEVNVQLNPTVLTLDQLNTNLQSRLVKLENVQFIAPQLSSTYADGDNQVDYDLMLEDANGNTATIRNSGYSNFAKELVAQGSGDLVCIVGIFGTSVQLIARSFDEINLNGARITPGIQMIKNFDDGVLTSGGWFQYSVLGPEVKWETSGAGGSATDYVVIRNYVDGANIPCENWLISPSINLTGVSSPIMTFENDVNYSGDQLKLLVSTDYDGSSNPSAQGTWTDITGSVSWDPNTNGWGFELTPDIDLSAFSGQNIRFAFKYTGTSGGGSTWEIDNIKITG